MSGLSLNNLKNGSFSNPCPPVTTRTRIFSAVAVAASAAEATRRFSTTNVRRIPRNMREVFIPSFYHSIGHVPKHFGQGEGRRENRLRRTSARQEGHTFRHLPQPAAHFPKKVTETGAWVT